MKILTSIIIVCIFAIASCTPRTEAELNKVATEVTSVAVIDNCQYIMSGVHGGYSFAHKGNCNNPIHIYRKAK